MAILRGFEMKGITFLAMAMLLFGLLPAQARNTASRQREGSESGDKRSATGKDVLPKPATDDPSYVIGPADVLNISVWKEPEITETVPVRPDGKISLPLLDDVQAAGLTPMQLGTAVTKRLRKYLTDPQVTVIVTEINSRRVYILGEVTRAGAYPLLPNMTVLQAISSAGGFTEFAKESKIYVLRMVNGKQAKFPFDYKAVVKGHKTAQNIALMPGDTVVVP